MSDRHHVNIRYYLQKPVSPLTRLSMDQLVAVKGVLFPGIVIADRTILQLLTTEGNLFVVFLLVGPILLVVDAVA